MTKFKRCVERGLLSLSSCGNLEQNACTFAHSGVTIWNVYLLVCCSPSELKPFILLALIIIIIVRHAPCQCIAPLATTASGTGK